MKRSPVGCSQVCNHPCLSYPLPYHFDPAILVRRCGKFAVLDRILVKLHATGVCLKYPAAMCHIQSPMHELQLSPLCMG